MHLSFRIWISMLIIAALLPIAGNSQQTTGGDQRVQPTAPVAPESGPPTPSEEPAASAGANPSPLTGAEEFTAGTRGKLRSYFSPSFQFSETADSNFTIGPGPQKWETIDSLVGRLALQRVGKRYNLTTDYLGGALLYNKHSEFNSTMHQLGISQSYQGRRWGIALDDRATYLPESSFGYGGFGWMGALGSDVGGASGSNLPGINPAFGLNQSIFSARGSRVANTTLMQIQYAPGERSSYTLSGSYGLLHFNKASASVIDSRNAFFLAGYNRNLTPRDSLGISYGYGVFWFQKLGESFRTHVLQLSYGHRITGRLAFELDGGAQLSVFHQPISGSNTPTTWTSQSSLDYRVRNGNVRASFIRYTTNGGGVLIGATTDLVQFAWTTGLTRKWTASLGPGYAHSRSLPQTTAIRSQYSYDSLYGMASLSRALGRYTTMFLSYDLQQQSSQAGICTPGSCGSSLLRHMVSFGFDWHPRQIAID